MSVCYHTLWKPSQKLTFAQNKFNSITALLSLLCELFIKTCPLNKEYLWLKSLVTEIKCIVSNFLFLFLFLVLVFVSFSYLYLSPSCICICLSGRLFLKYFPFLLVQSLHLFNQWASFVPKVGQQLWKRMVSIQMFQNLSMLLGLTRQNHSIKCFQIEI